MHVCRLSVMYMFVFIKLSLFFSEASTMGTGSQTPGSVDPAAASDGGPGAPAPQGVTADRDDDFADFQEAPVPPPANSGLLIKYSEPWITSQ